MGMIEVIEEKSGLALEQRDRYRALALDALLGALFGSGRQPAAWEIALVAELRVEAQPLHRRPAEPSPAVVRIDKTVEAHVEQLVRESQALVLRAERAEANLHASEARCKELERRLAERPTAVVDLRDVELPAPHANGHAPEEPAPLDLVCGDGPGEAAIEAVADARAAETEPPPARKKPNGARKWTEEQKAAQSALLKKRAVERKVAAQRTEPAEQAREAYRAHLDAGNPYNSEFEGALMADYGLSLVRVREIREELRAERNGDAKRRQKRADDAKWAMPL